MPTESRPHLLLINPWIHDFAAYDYWVKPLGLLSLAAWLRRRGFGIDFIDCLDTPSPSPRKPGGQGKFRKEPIDKPSQLKSVPRHYSRYGMKPKEFSSKLEEFSRPDAILVTSSMTYWYPGVFEAIRLAREEFPRVPVALGGIYATLCTAHARATSGADVVFTGSDPHNLLKLLGALTKKPTRMNLQGQPIGEPFHLYPAFDLYGRFDYVTMLSSHGCPYRCPYCASHFLSPAHVPRTPAKVVEELAFWAETYRVSNVAFYDDALLASPETHFIPIFEKVLRRSIRLSFHAPNGLHIRGITERVAELLFQAPFRTIRFGLETSDGTMLRKTGNKTTPQEFLQALRLLRGAGYSPDEIGVYLLAGLPGQKAREVEDSIRFVQDAGARPFLTEYSPVPGTPFWEEALKISSYDLLNEPLFHNNSIIPCENQEFTRDDLNRLKHLLLAPQSPLPSP